MISKFLKTVIIAGLIAVINGQSASPVLEFEVATIKPSPPPGYTMIVGCFGGPGTKDPLRLRCTNATVAYIVGHAFELGTGEFKYPSGMDDRKFDLTANVPAGTTKQQFLIMFQTLVQQRFNLAYHRVEGQADGYELLIAKGGHKLTSSPQRDPVSSENEVAPAAAVPKLDKDGFPALQGVGASFMNDRARIYYTDQTMNDLARKLSRYSRARVVDRTGLGDEKFDIALHWVVEGRSSQSAEDSGPNLLSAVSAQLGLKLEAKKVGVSVFVVDHADKMPADN